MSYRGPTELKSCTMRIACNPLRGMAFGPGARPLTGHS